jgi:SAM-dependent methyltransferase
MSSGPDLDSQRVYYDERWARMTHANPLQAGRAAAVLDGMRRIGRPSPRILDLGCGTGWLTAILGQFGPTTGVDLSPLAIEQAKKRFPELEFLAGSLFDVPLPRGAFDIVVTCQVVEHVEDQRRFVDLLADLLRPDGHLLLVTDNAWNLARWDPEALARFAGAPQPIQRRATPRQLRTLLAPRFSIRRLRTLLPGHGDRGLLRFAHSARWTRVLERAGLRDAYHAGLLRMGFGLVVFVSAQRR